MTRPRIRTLKPGNWSDEAVGSLTRDARLLRDVLVTFADDDGRWRHLPSAIIGFGYPYDNDVTAAKIKRWTKELVEAALAHIYEVSGTTYGCFPTWHRHQQISKYSPSDLPPPADIEPVPRRERSGTRTGIGPESYESSPVVLREDDGRSPTLSRASLSLSSSCSTEGLREKQALVPNPDLSTKRLSSSEKVA